MKRFFECLVPVTACNLKCEYCYIIQQDRRKKKYASFEYDPVHIGKALSVNRLGGVSYISICGSGETLLQKDLCDIVLQILKQGHYVNITTNGTITKRFKQIIKMCSPAYLERLHFAFSFHYLELIRTNTMDIFFQNISMVRNAGCSFLVQINLYDKYMPHWNNIKEIVKKHTGSLPQVALTRNTYGKEITILTKRNQADYISIGKQMDSPLFDFTVKNFMVKRKEFCYAGDWSGKLDLATGILTGCYGAGIKQNIFKNIDKAIKFEAIGKNCIHKYCINSSHFLSLGVIPTLKTPTYAHLRDRKDAGWYSSNFRDFLTRKLSDDNDEYSLIKKKYINIKVRCIESYRYLRGVIKHYF